MTESPQVQFWRGDFGNEYLNRNAVSDERIRNQIRFWARLVDIMVRAGRSPSSILEVGANVGINLRALKQLVDSTFYVVEPNASARGILVRDGVVPPENAFDAAGEAIPLADESVDMAFTAGVLIHVHPDNLAQVCSEIYRVARRTIICAEYFSVRPETIDYRGHAGKLFKRDFGSFWMERYPALRLVDYGFAWKPATGLDNITWWMFTKAD